MIDTNLWNEVWTTINKRRRQSLMTAFGVFWGILMLTMLLSTGKGMERGIMGRLNKLASNVLWIIPQETSMSYRGFGRDRKWLLNWRDEELIRQHFGTKLVSYSAVGFAGYQNVSYGEQAYQYQLTGVAPQFVSLLPQRMIAGRFINDIDVEEHRKVCVIGEGVAATLFGSNQKSLGQTIQANGTALTVIGVTHSTNRNVYIGIELSESILMPLTTEQVAYGKGQDIDMCTIELDESLPMDLYKDEIVDIVKANHSIHPDDPVAMMTLISADQLNIYKNLFDGTKILIWIIGLGTLIAGLIGITNIMLVTVKERTQEIGIRRAIGAKPRDIMMQIVLESLLLTLSAGFMGLTTAVWLMYLIANQLPQDDDAFIANPFIPFWTAIIALLILVAGGMLAGLMPARRALAVKPIDALRED